MSNPLFLKCFLSPSKKGHYQNCPTRWLLRMKRLKFFLVLKTPLVKPLRIMIMECSLLPVS